jgi:hypothetical protein
MGVIIDKTALKQILEVTCSILINKFFYEPETVIEDLNYLGDYLSEELEIFQAVADEDFILELENDKVVRLYFTCYFISTHLREFLIGELHFSEQELKAFENFLPKIGESRNEKHQPQPKHERAYYRKFFE